MTGEMRKQITSFFLILLLSSTVQAAGKELDQNLIEKTKHGHCGYIRGKWVPGLVLKNGNFYKLAQKIRALEAKRKRSVSGRGKLVKKINKALKQMENET